MVIQANNSTFPYFFLSFFPPLFFSPTFFFSFSISFWFLFGSWRTLRFGAWERSWNRPVFLKALTQDRMYPNRVSDKYENHPIYPVLLKWSTTKVPFNQNTTWALPAYDLIITSSIAKERKKSMKPFQVSNMKCCWISDEFARFIERPSRCAFDAFRRFAIFKRIEPRSACWRKYLKCLARREGTAKSWIVPQRIIENLKRIWHGVPRTKRSTTNVTYSTEIANSAKRKEKKTVTKQNRKRNLK